ncbi:hypothetical protein [Pantoea septica]|uniref:hypothetical protein n=1 Tax=Pantoea septica TaxID=472695 RepID=UPI0023F745D6|nr:hypothetical protein [Pantoea septica]
MRNPGKVIRAYSVQGNDGGCVVFAISNVIARRDGAERLECSSAEVVSCRLAPEFDSYAEAGRVPRQALVEKHGWWQYCSYCENQVNANTDGRVWDEDAIYCDVRCQALYIDRDRDWRTERDRRSAAENEAVALARETFAGITNIRAVTDMKKVTLVYFDFPGCTNSAVWQAGQQNVRVGLNEVEAWEAYRAPYRAKEKADV